MRKQVRAAIRKEKSCKYNKLVRNRLTKEKQTHRYRAQTSGYQWGEGRGRGQIGGGEQEV